MQRGSWIVAGCVAVAVFAAASPTAAQDDAGILWFTAEALEGRGVVDNVIENESPCDHRVYNATTEPVEEAGAAAGSASYLAFGCSTDFNHTVAASFVAQGEAHVQVYLRCDAASVSYPAGISSWRVTLLKNHAPVGEETLFGGSGACAPGDVEEQAFDVAFDEATAFEAGDTLTVRMVYWRSNAPEAASHVHFLVGGDQASHAVVPGLAAAVAEDEETPGGVEDLLPASDRLVLEESFDAPTNASLRYAWPSSLEGSVELEYAAEITAGVLSVLVVDGGNQTILEGAFDASSAAIVAPVEGVVAGNWTIRIDAEAAAGSLFLRIEPYAAPQDPADPSGAPPGDGQEANRTTDGEALDDEEDRKGGALPGPGVGGALVAAILSAGVLARRRLA